MTASTSWLSENARIYFGNAASRKDYRVQMRGAKPFWVFTCYVLSLGIIGFMFYATTLGRPGLSLANAQSELSTFFSFLMGILAAAICLIAPGLTGSAIVAEKQRLSLDLVLTAPIEPKYFLVGKMISSYRYIWMLLALALPVVALSVVLGGATWWDVFGCFLLLSFHAMVFTSLSLLISSVTSKPAAAVIWSLIAVAAFAFASSAIASTALTGMFTGNSSHLPFTIAVSPFFPLQAVNSTTPIGSWEVPNWVFGVLISLLLTRLFLLGAAVNMAPLDKRLSANLRITGLVYTFGLAVLVAYAMQTILNLSRGSSSGPNPDLMLTLVALGCSLWLIIGTCYFACYGKDGSKRFWLNGRFSLRRAFDGTPAGGLPYMLLLYAASYAGVVIGARFVLHLNLGPVFWSATLWPLGYTVLNWSIGQLMSSATSALKTARVLTLVILAASPLLFNVFMGWMGLAPPWASNGSTSTSNLWYIWPYAPLTGEDIFASAWVYGLVMLGIGLLVFLWARTLENQRSLRLASA